MRLLLDCQRSVLPVATGRWPDISAAVARGCHVYTAADGVQTCMHARLPAAACKNHAHFGMVLSRLISCCQVNMPLIAAANGSQVGKASCIPASLVHARSQPCEGGLKASCNRQEDENRQKGSFPSPMPRLVTAEWTWLDCNTEHALDALTRQDLLTRPL